MAKTLFFSPKSVADLGLEILGLEKITVVITKNFELPQSSKNDEKLPR
jgi:hypothetical protein